MNDTDNEITKIYQQIEKDLLTSEPSDKESDDIRLTAGEERAETVETTPAESVTADYVSPSPEELTAKTTEPESGIEASFNQKNDRDMFYKETVKNETYKIKRTRFQRTIAIVCIVCLLGGGSLGFGIGMAIPFAQKIINSGNKTEPTREAFAFKEAGSISNDTGAAVARSADAIVNAVEKVEPSVVNISSISRTNQGAQSFFGIPIEQGPAAGSGIIFEQDNEKVYIATNHHVVSSAQEVKVSINGSEYVPAKPIGNEAASDLAVIFIDKKDVPAEILKNLTISTFGDSDQMRVGETVIAIGNAMGEGNTATMGIVSAKDKKITVEQKTLTVIQTDAAINPGNSGGPLINLNGDVIGINTAKLSETNFEGMGYSIPSNIAKPIIAEIMNKTSRAFLGIEGYDVDKEFSETYNIPQLGVIVNSVVKGSSAEKAGIKRFDVIVGFNGDSIFTMEQLQEKIKACSVGDLVEVKLLRGKDNPITLKVKLSEMSTDDF